MVLEFLFSAAVGTAITGAIFERLDKVKSEGLRSEYLKAVDYHQRGKYKEAISILDKLIQSDRLNPIIYMQLWYSWGKLAATQRNNKNVFLSAVDRVFEYYEIILQLDRQGISLPADVLAEIKKYTPMFQTYKDVLTGKLLVQSDKGEEYKHKSDLAEKAGDYKKALRYITKAIEVETNDVLIAFHHTKRALIRARLGDYAAALTDCKIALKCQTLDGERRKITEQVQNSVKAAQCEQDSFLAAQAQDGEKALQCITKAIELETNDASIAKYHAERAFIREIMGDYAGALSDCRIALKCEELDDRIKKFARNTQRSVQNRRRVDKTASTPKSTTGRVRTRTKANAKKTRKRAV